MVFASFERLCGSRGDDADVAASQRVGDDEELVAGYADDIGPFLAVVLPVVDVVEREGVIEYADRLLEGDLVVPEVAGGWRPCPGPTRISAWLMLYGETVGVNSSGQLIRATPPR
jgi:hypothetical protein